MSTETTVNNLIINKLTKAQYDNIQNPSETELYLVEETVDTTPTSGSENFVTSGGIYNALASHYTKSEVDTALGNKQDTISDLATIRSGAASGATAYQKPNTGIPSTDMAQAVQTSLSKADTALQQHQDISGKQDALVSGTNIKTINNQSILGNGNITIQGGESNVQSDWNQVDTEADDYIKNKPTIPTVPTNVSAFSNDAGYLTQHQSLSDYVQKSQTAGLIKNDGTIDTNTYLTQHQDISGKENVTTIIAPVNTTDATLPITTLTCEVGKYYRIDVAVDTLAITLPAISDLTTVKTIVIYLTGGTTPAITISSSDSKDVYYQDGFEIEAGSTYEINALFNGDAWIVASVKINIE